MKRWQLATLAALFLVPVAVYVGWSGYALWKLGGVGYYAWLLPLAWTLAWWLARRWQPRSDQQIDGPAEHWTQRDEAAWEIVKKQAGRAVDVTPESLLDPHFYLTTSQKLALDIARHYHPQAADPLGPLTVPEVMAAAELALRDTSQWVRTYVPGSHLLRIDHWRLIAEAPRWGRIVGNVWWVGSIVLNPADLIRQLISKLTVDSASREVQTGLLACFYSVFVQRAGFYLIEVHSGRLRRGADHYLDAQRRFGPAAPQAAFPLDDRPAPVESRTEPAVEPARDTTAPRASASSSSGASDEAISLVVIGQAKAGKSSLINGLLGKAEAAVDILPCTKSVRRYRWKRGAAGAELVLLDTPGYADDGLTDEQLEELETALENADGLLVVMKATSPARSADLAVLDRLRQRRAARPELKAPPTIGVLTHIDGLRPVLEWAPPYDWQAGERPKEKSIRDAVSYQREVFGDRLVAIAPVCTDVAHDRLYGLQDWLLPAIVSKMSEARACAFLRYLHEDWNDHKIEHLWQQLSAIGKSLWSLRHGISLDINPRARNSPDN